jgi:hypothetical protein
MSEQETDKDGQGLPKPDALTPEQFQQVAAGHRCGAAKRVQ